MDVAGEAVGFGNGNNTNANVGLRILPTVLRNICGPFCVYV